MKTVTYGSVDEYGELREDTIRTVPVRDYKIHDIALLDRIESLNDLIFETEGRISYLRWQRPNAHTKFQAAAIARDIRALNRYLDELRAMLREAQAQI